MPSRAPLAGAAALLLLLATPTAALDRYVAVKEVTGLSGPSDRAFLAKLSGRIRAAAIDELRGRYQVMMPDNIEQILKRSGKKGQEILAQCGEASCAAQLGQILGADVVIAGAIAELDGTLDLTIEVYDVATANVLGSRSVRGKGRLELVDQALEATALLLRSAISSAGPDWAADAPRERTAAPRPQLEEDVIVAFETSPDGAKVSVDGQVLCEATPCRKRIAAGSHDVLLERSRYVESKQRIAAAKGTIVKATLAPRFGWIAVDTTPPGLRVSIDGNDVGKAPIGWREADGAVEVAIGDGCWAPHVERVVVKGGERRELRIAARPRVALVKVNAEDERGNAVDAEVSVDGAVVGPAGKPVEVPVCARRVTVPIGAFRFEAEPKLDEGKLVVLTAKPPRAEPPRSAAASRAGAAEAGGDMVALPGGSFRARELGGLRKDQVQIQTVSAFALDRTEVTVERYDACVRAGACSPAATTVEWEGIRDLDRVRWSPLCNGNRADRAAHPLNCVDWNQAVAYCRWRGKRLPSEGEWEWAARAGGDAAPYPWGREAPSSQLCWSGDEASSASRVHAGTCPVGAFSRGDTASGVKDLAGNVWEWTATVEWSNAASYIGATTGKVIRGGSWLESDPARVSAGVRVVNEESRRSVDVGFRCAKDL